MEQEPRPAPLLQGSAADATGSSAPPPADSIFPGESGGALDKLDSHPLGKHVTTVFRCWIVVFGLVTATASLLVLMKRWIFARRLANKDVQFQLAWWGIARRCFQRSFAETSKLTPSLIKQAHMIL
jgi:hypothetical protein